VPALSGDRRGHDDATTPRRNEARRNEARATRREATPAVHDHHDVIATRDDVVARVLSGDDGVEDAIALLDRAEADLEVPLVDEAERQRLTELATGDTERPSHWHSLLARRGDRAVGYAGALLPTAPGLTATGDIAVLREGEPCTPVLGALLAGLEGLGWQHLAGRLQVWVRHAQPSDVVCATDEGYGVDRRLGVLGRWLDRPLPDGAEVVGTTVRAYRPDVDDAGVVEVLAAAYAGTADGGWDLARFRERRGLSWFRAEDLLVAQDDDGWIAGIHWLKRRSEDVGEVYNLAIHPRAQGRGLGGVLLAAGLRHLAEVGCRDALLWVDLANERAVRLYISQGFTTRWEDVAFARTLRGTGSMPSASHGAVAAG
jgi:mycothiol synthase